MTSHSNTLFSGGAVMSTCSKKPYQSKKAARGFMRRAKRFGGNQRAYQCATCRKWHLTTRADGLEPSRRKVQNDPTPNPARKSVPEWFGGWLASLGVLQIEEECREKCRVGDTVLIPEDEMEPSNPFVKPVAGYYRVVVEDEEGAEFLSCYPIYRGNSNE